MDYYVKSISLETEEKKKRFEIFDGEDISQQLMERILTEIKAGVTLSLFAQQNEEDWSLNLDIKAGWASIVINDFLNDDRFYQHFNPTYADSTEEAPVCYAGQSPTQKRNACQDMELTANIVIYFLKTGGVYPWAEWECTICQGPQGGQVERIAAKPRQPE